MEIKGLLKLMYIMFIIPHLYVTEMSSIITIYSDKTKPLDKIKRLEKLT